MDWIEEQNRIPVLGSYDVLVVGGGVAEVAAAGAAARSVAHAAHRKIDIAGRTGDDRSYRYLSAAVRRHGTQGDDGHRRGTAAAVDPPRL